MINKNNKFLYLKSLLFSSHFTNYTCSVESLGILWKINKYNIFSHQVICILYYSTLSQIWFCQRTKRASENKKQSEFINRVTNLSFHIFLLITFTSQLSHHLTLSDSCHSSYLYKFPSPKKGVHLPDKYNKFWMEIQNDVLFCYITSTNIDYIMKVTIWGGKKEPIYIKNV